jgi:malate dehydrogenase
MATVAILGAGDIGGACAHVLAFSDSVRRVLLIDSAADAAQGKALDIWQAGAIDGFHTELRGTDDESLVADCAVCVIADRFSANSPEWSGDAALGLIKRIAAFAPDIPMVFAGATQADLIRLSSQEGKVPPHRVIGAATEALASAVAAIVAMEARCSPGEVSVAVLGTPPAAFVIPWSEASIGGYALERVLAQVQLRRIEARVARLWPPGPFLLGAAAAHVVRALVHASRRSYNVLTVLAGEFGVRNRVGAVPALLSPRGIVRTRVPALNTRERVLLDTALGV